MNLIEMLFEHLDKNGDEMLEPEEQVEMYNDFTLKFLDENGESEKAFRVLYHQATMNAFKAGFNVAKELMK